MCLHESSGFFDWLLWKETTANSAYDKRLRRGISAGDGW
jgi:hypothetical protein